MPIGPKSAGMPRIEPDLPGIRAARRQVRPAGSGLGPEPVRLHLPGHEPARPVPPRADLASDHLRRDVRHHDHAAGRPRRPAHPGRRADRVSPARRLAMSNSAASPPGIRATRAIAAISSARSRSRSRCSCRPSRRCRRPVHAARGRGADLISPSLSPRLPPQQGPTPWTANQPAAAIAASCGRTSDRRQRGHPDRRRSVRRRLRRRLGARQPVRSRRLRRAHPRRASSCSAARGDGRSSCATRSASSRSPRAADGADGRRRALTHALRDVSALRNFEKIFLHRAQYLLIYDLPNFARACGRVSVGR